MMLQTIIGATCRGLPDRDRGIRGKSAL